METGTNKKTKKFPAAVSHTLTDTRLFLSTSLCCKGGVAPAIHTSTLVHIEFTCTIAGSVAPR